MRLNILFLLFIFVVCTSIVDASICENIHTLTDIFNDTINNTIETYVIDSNVSDYYMVADVSTSYDNVDIKIFMNDFYINFSITNIFYFNGTDEIDTNIPYWKGLNYTIIFNSTNLGGGAESFDTLRIGINDLYYTNYAFTYNFTDSEPNTLKVESTSVDINNINISFIYLDRYICDLASVDEISAPITSWSSLDIITTSHQGWKSNDSLDIEYIDFIDNIDNCSLYVNDMINLTNTTITSGTVYGFYIENLAEDNYTWNVRCVNESDIYYSNNQTFYVDTIYPLIDNGTSDATSYLSTSSALLSVNCTDTNIDNVYYAYEIDGVSQGTNDMNYNSLTGKYEDSLSLSSGSYDITAFYCDDYVGNSNSTTGVTFSVTDPDSGAGGGGGGVIYVDKKFGNFTIYPSNNISYNYISGIEQIGEFRIINKEPTEVPIKIKFNRLLSTKNIDSIFKFSNTDLLELDITLSPTGGISNPFLYVRYLISIPDDSLEKLDKDTYYVVVLDVISATKSEQVRIDIDIGTSLFGRIKNFLLYEIYTYDNEFDVYRINATDEEVLDKQFISASLRVWHVIGIIGIISLVLILRFTKSRRYGR